jgi:Domain of unknown function (DUF4384)
MLKKTTWFMRKSLFNIIEEPLVRRALGLTLSIATMVPAALAVVQNQLNARDLYVMGAAAVSTQRQNPENSPIKAPLGFRWSVLKAGSSGQFAETDADTTFHTGDRIRFRIQVNDNGYLYIVSRGTSGMWDVLFPAPQINGGSNHVVRSQHYEIPGESSAAFLFTPPSGSEGFFIVLSRQPITPLMEVPSPNTPSLADAVIREVRDSPRSRDVVLTKGTVDANDPAIYVANPNGHPDDWVVADLLLMHQ